MTKVAKGGADGTDDILAWGVPVGCQNPPGLKLYEENLRQLCTSCKRLAMTTTCIVVLSYLQLQISYFALQPV